MPSRKLKKSNFQHLLFLFKVVHSTNKSKKPVFRVQVQSVYTIKIAKRKRFKIGSNFYSRIKFRKSSKRKFFQANPLL